MLQITLKGKIIDFKETAGRPGSKKTSVLTLEVRAFRLGAPVMQIVCCTFDEYWTERLGKLDPKTKYLTVRGSDVVPTHETDAKGTTYNLLWVKAEEFFL